LNAGYDRLASKDEDNSTVSYDDVHLWYHVLMGIESGGKSPDILLQNGSKFIISII